ncbi:MAG: hypothetical protein GY851_09185 [bacterium]|nr:hypothetical protein [bacterium]
MADDPMTLSSVTEYVMTDGLKFVAGVATGPSDYDATNGAAMDVSSYVQTIVGGISFNGVTAKADALIYPTYVNDDYTDADGGAVYFTWGTAEDDEAFRNVSDQSDLDAYQWHFSFVGTEVTRT